MKTVMQEDKETAIEWLIRMLYSPTCVGFISGRRVIPHEIIKQALEKEKEQIMYSYLQGSFDDGPNITNSEQYYNQTFNQNK